MPQGNVTNWLQFAIQQMAAESYLDDLNQLVNRLKLGNNNIPNADPNGPVSDQAGLASPISRRNNLSSVTRSSTITPTMRRGFRRP